MIDLTEITNITLDGNVITKIEDTDGNQLWINPNE